MKYLSILAVLAVCLVGCQSQPEPDTKVETSRLEAAREMRQIYTKVNGDYNALTPADKETLLKQFNGNEADAKKSWDFMAGRSASPAAGSSGSNTP